MAHKEKVKAWLQLMRLPNLATVPGDPLAGLCLAGGEPGWNLLWLSLASLGLYLSGVILNDVADLEIDRRERPDRPLPSGAVGRADAARAGVLAAAGGLGAASMAGPRVSAAAAFLLVLILTYTFVTRRGSAAGIGVMGLCRAASVGLGIAAAAPGAASAANPWLAPAAAAGLGLYIAAVSWLAAGETRAQYLGVKRWLPTLVAALVLGAVITTCRGYRHLNIVVLIAAYTVIRTALVAAHLGRRPPPVAVPPAIGAYIRLLLPLQAAFCATLQDGLPVAIMLLALLPVSTILGRFFHAS